MATRNPTRWDVARELRFWHWKVGGSGLAVLALGWLINHFGGGLVGHPVMLIGLLVWTLTTGWWWWDRLLRPLDSRATVTRAKEYANHSEGTASVWDLAQHASGWAMRQRARILRPSLAGLTGRQLRRLPVTLFSVKVATVGWSLGIFSRTLAVMSSIEDATLRLGGPRMGKSGSLACHIQDAPGMVLVTSTRLDLYEATHRQRSATGRVIVFNPTGLGALPSTMRWSPLAGCKDYPTAQRRAEAMIPERTGDAQHWSVQARRVLAVLLHAAALKGHRLQRVADWVSDATPAVGEEIIAALNGAANPRALVSEVRLFIGMNERTRTSITGSIQPALGWLANAQCAEIGDAPVEELGTTDVRSVIEAGQDTIYLMGSMDVTAVTPLISALTSEMAYQLRMVAAVQPAGRLDPPATMVLDEMALTCPEIRPDQWTADMGGRNVTIHMSTQSLSQMRQVWGDDAAASILNNVGTLLVFGGTKDKEDLQSLVELVGQRLEQVDEDDRRYTAVLDPARISGMARFEVLVFAPGVRPVLGTAPMVWHRRSKRAGLVARLRARFARPAQPSGEPIRLRYPESTEAGEAA